MSAAVVSNDAMVPGRFARWAVARRKLAWMHARWAEGCTVYVSTHMRHTALKAKHAGLVAARTSGLYMASGKRWDCIDYCQLTARQS